MTRPRWAAVLSMVAGFAVAVVFLSSLPAATAAEPLSRDQIWAACADRLAARPSDAWLQGCVAAMAPDPTPSATPSPSTVPTTPPVSTTPASTTPAGTSTPPPTTTSSPTPPAGAWPNPTNTGVPAFWQPVTTRSTSLTVTQAGAVVQDILFTGSAGLNIRANNVVVRRVLFQGGKVDGGSGCPSFRLEQVTFNRPANADGDFPTVQHGNYVADRVKMDGVTEGLRVGGRSAFACGPVTISNSWVRVQSETNCSDWHGDGIQGYDGPALTIRNVALWLDEQGCGGTAPFFYPRNQGNTSVDIDRLLVRGGGYAFRNGMSGQVTNLKITNGSWSYGPIDVRCSVLTAWQADIVTIDGNWQPTTVRAQPCNTEAGF